MKRTFLLTLLFTLLSAVIYAQGDHVECGCPENQFSDAKADTVFRFSDGHAIALCGFRMPGDSDPTYSEFVLAVCGDDKVIHFWDAMTECRLTSQGDTLLVEELYALPTADDFQSEDIVWTKEKIYFTDKELKREKSVNDKIKKYSAAQIQQVLESYRNADDSFDESKMILANQLFVAALSGSKEASNNFMQFAERYEVPSGALSQEYRILQEMLLQWDTDQKEKGQQGIGQQI